MLLPTAISAVFVTLYSVSTADLQLACSIIHPLPIPTERYMWTPMDSPPSRQENLEEVCIIASAALNNTDTKVTFPSQQAIELFHPTIPYLGPHLFGQLGPVTTSLELRRGNVTELLYGQSTLKHLKLSDTGLNHFDVLPQYDFPLQTLVIHERLITVLPSHVNILTGLKLLDLSGCSLTTVDLSRLDGLHSLLSLNLADNQLSTVEGEADLPALAKIDVRQNELSRIDRFPDMFPALRYARIMQNRWDCEWVSEARAKFWHRNITVLGTDFHCGRRINNGGLCCTYSHPARARLGIAKAVLSVLEELGPNRGDVQSMDPLITFKVFENETVEAVVGVETENVGIYLHDPIGAA